jgi:lipid A 4'-phosphatase
MAEREIASRGSAARISAAPARRFVDPLSLTPLYMAMAGLAAISLLFMAFPALDLRFAALFHIDGAFPAARIPELVTLRLLGKDLVILVCLALLASLGAKLARPPRPMPIRASHVWFLFATLALGPGLIVNGVLKSFWGRPRPIQVDLFGGAAPFEPAWKIGGTCLSNCSFVSGEAASAVWLIALAMLAPPRYRPALAGAVGALAFALSLNRIAFGGHFLSDVLIAWGITLVILLGLHRVMVAGPFSARIDAATEGALAKIALAATFILGRIARGGPRDPRSNGLGRVDRSN